MSIPNISGPAEVKVQETADDAALSKMSAVRMGYINDPFISFFVRKPQRRSPLINRGYFSRMAAVDVILRRFFAICHRTHHGTSTPSKTATMNGGTPSPIFPCQVISLGAGMDSTYFRTIGEGIIPQLYVELDFPDVTTRKASIIRKHDILQKCIRGDIPNLTEITQAQSHLSPAFHQQPSSSSPFSNSKANASPVHPTVNRNVKSPLVHGLSFGGKAATVDGEGHIHGLSAVSSSSSTTTSSTSVSSSASSSSSIPVVSPVHLNLVSPNGSTPSNDPTTVPSSSTTTSTTTTTTDSSNNNNNPSPLTTFTPTSDGGINVHGKYYRLVTADLRDIEAVHNAVKLAGIDFSVPTLLLSECVLVYLEPEESCSIIAWAARSFAHSVFVTYEQIRPHDAFGRVMAKNLEERGYTLRGLHAFPDIAAQTSRYKELGYQSCSVIDMNDIYYRILPKPEIARIERLEIFDEIEEWHLMSAHYAIAVAVNDKSVTVGNVPLSAERKSREKVKYIPDENIAAKRMNSGVFESSSSLSSVQHDNSTNTTNTAVPFLQVTDMPAPAPKIPRISSYNVTASSVSSSNSTTPVSANVRNSMDVPGVPGSISLHTHVPHSTTTSTTSTNALYSTNALSPVQLAVAVVTAHEIEEGIARERRNSIRSMSTSPNPSIGRRSRSRSLSIAADSDLETSSVTTSNLHDLTNMSVSSASRSNHHHHHHRGGSSSGHPNHPNSAHSLTSPSGHSIGSHHSTFPPLTSTSSFEQDHIVVDSHGSIDFQAIAESEEEIDNARYIRNIAGIDNNANNNSNHHDMLHSSSRSSSRMSNSSSTTVSTSSYAVPMVVDTTTVTAANNGTSVVSSSSSSSSSSVHTPVNVHPSSSSSESPHQSLSASSTPSRGGTINNNNNAVTSYYDIASIMEATHSVSLLDSLFPIHKWNDPLTSQHQERRSVL